MDDNPYQAPTTAYAPLQATAHDGPNGLGGWLILVALSLTLTALGLARAMIHTYVPIFTEGHWGVITEPTSEFYHPMWGPLIVFEILGNLTIIVASVVGLVLYFRRSPLFPTVIICYYTGGLALVVIDYFACSMIPALVETESARATELIKSLILCMIWVPYICYSRRVKNTFRRPPDQPATVFADEADVATARPLGKP